MVHYTKTKENRLYGRKAREGLFWIATFSHRIRPDAPNDQMPKFEFLASSGQPKQIFGQNIETEKASFKKPNIWPKPKFGRNSSFRLK